MHSRCAFFKKCLRWVTGALWVVLEWTECESGAVNFYSIIGNNTKKQMEDIFSVTGGTPQTIHHWFSIFSLFEAKACPKWKLCARLQATFRELKTPLIYPRETLWHWWFWIESWKYFLFLLLPATSPLLLVVPQELNPSNQHHMSLKAAGKLWNLLLPL